MPLTAHSVDSPLGRWTHHHWTPPSLADVVDHLWHFEGWTTHPRERGFPGPYVELILHLGARYRAVDASGRAGDQFPLACAAGILLRPEVIEAPRAGSRVLGIRLRPLGASRVLGVPATELTGVTLDLGDLVGASVALRLVEECAALPGAAQQLQHVAGWLERRLARAIAPPSAVAWAAAALEARRGVVSVAALRERVGLSSARFASTFRAHVGVTPKRYGRVLRFRHALGLLQAGVAPSAAAQASGYYDQPHLNADFREFAGMPPCAFTGATRYPNSPSLAENA